MTKRRLSFDEHADLGLVLASIRDELLHRSTQVANAYPRTEAAVRHLNAAVEALDKARSDLDNAVFNEYPQNAETTVYYPNEADRIRIQP